MDERSAQILRADWRLVPQSLGMGQRLKIFLSCDGCSVLDALTVV
jgi:hypothetical protein